MEKIFHDEESVRRFVHRFPERRSLRACYEAGPTGYGLYHLLHTLEVRCEVVAPSLIPKAPGDRVKTDRRDACRLARLHRAGELRPIRVPGPEEEAVRDLCRARVDLVEDLDRARRRLGAFLLRHSQVWRGGSRWTLKHQAWLRSLRFEDAAAGLDLVPLPGGGGGPHRGARRRGGGTPAVLPQGPVRRGGGPPGGVPGGGRGGSPHPGLGGVRRRRFPWAASFMGFAGLGVSEYSTGGRTRRGHITKTQQLLSRSGVLAREPPGPRCGPFAPTRLQQLHVAGGRDLSRQCGIAVGNGGRRTGR
ncbi:MAG TPA: transposase [Actinomycetota bacterium]|nr:transposase [Actinomycetota bacterium]